MSASGQSGTLVLIILPRCFKRYHMVKIVSFCKFFGGVFNIVLKICVDSCSVLCTPRSVYSLF